MLLNNIAWALRRFPLFPIPSGGTYPVQSGFVEDIADLAVTLSEEEGNVEGTEKFEYIEYVRRIWEVVGALSAGVIPPHGLVEFGTRVVGAFVRDVVLTREEIIDLSRGLLASEEPSGREALPTRFSDWLPENAASLGRAYDSEVERHYR